MASIAPKEVDKFEARLFASLFKSKPLPKYEQFKDEYYDAPDRFVQECLWWPKGTGPTEYQLEALRAVPEHGRVLLRGPHTLGKTAFESWLIHWFALTRDGTDWKIITTAGSWRQLTNYLWPEVHKWSRRLNWKKIGRPAYNQRTELLTLSLSLETGRASTGAAANPETMEGAHADHLLYLFDEAKAIPSAIFDQAEGAFAGAGGEGSPQHAFAVAASTPGDMAGRFYEIAARKRGFEDWHAIHVKKARVISAGRMTAEWAEQRRRQWGEQSAVYKNRVLGEFAGSPIDGVIPLSWVEAAIERWYELQARHFDREPLTGLGVDVGRGGDKSVAAPLCGDAIVEFREYSYNDTMQTAREVMRLLDEYEADENSAPAVIDVIGVGAGVLDRVAEEGYAVIPFNASERSEETDDSGLLSFVNKRAEGWWRVRELLNPANNPTLALPDNEMMVADLTEPRWKQTSSGKILIESKEDVSKRLKRDDDTYGRSTDYGDAVVHAIESRARRVRSLIVQGEARGW